MTAKTKLIAAASAAVIAAAGWFGYRQALPEAYVGRVLRGTAVQAVPANVIVSAEFVMEIKSEQGGRIVKRHAKLGQEVKAGDLLFEIDPQDLEIEIAQIETDHKAAKSRIELGSPLRFDIATAEENVKNNTRLFESGRVSQVDFDRIKRNLEVLKDRLANEDIDNRKTLENFENTLKLKRRALAKMKVTAPDDGTVIDLPVQTGDLIGAGQTLGRVISRSRLVMAQISEENFAGVRPGLPVAVQFLGYYGVRFTGKVERVLPSADERTKRYTAFLGLDIPEDKLVPGLTGEASITVDQRENALLVERRSLAGSKLYAVRSGRIQITPVSLGFVGQSYAEITAGLAEGDMIVLDDLSAYKNGQRVRVIETDASLNN